ncbi:MAG: hypothetical protein KDC84_13015 [Crocinitomicaceae bacterium]|nr:hypothetical protein [Crocinitomicaceae bacterium]
MKKGIFKGSIVTAVVAGSMLVVACGGEDTKKSDANTVQQNDNDTSNNEQVSGFELPGIPTPNDLFDLVKAVGVQMKPGITNDVAKVSEYVDSKSKALNFGVYSADLGYIACFEAGPDFLGYFKVIQKLGDDLGISAAFDQTLIDRIENNDGNLDSLFSISESTYFESYAFLEENGKGKELALIIAGGWVESMHIIFELSGDYKDGAVLNESIAGQQVVLESILEFMARYQDDDMMEIMDKFSNVLMTYTENMTYVETETEVKKEGDKVILGGGSEFAMNEMAYNEIRKQIQELRTYITK